MSSNASMPSKMLAFRPAAPQNKLSKLYSVTITHSYYTADGGLCPDFDIVPTPSSAQLMSSLNMAFRAENAGFGIYIEQGSRDKLARYLRDHTCPAGPGAGCWERLTFSLRLKNPLFVSITQLPVHTVSSKKNLYGGNLQAHTQGKTVLLNSGQVMDGAALYQVSGDELPLTLPANAHHVVVRDISGAIVIPATESHRIRIHKMTTGGDGFATVVFSGQPYDLYTVCVSDAQNLPINDAVYPLSVLYLEQQPASMVLLDMLFTQPTPESPGVFPLPLLPAKSGDAAYNGVSYQLAFDARRTLWQYFVVSQEAGSELTGLQIQGTDMVFTRRTAPAILPDGSTAIVFDSPSPLPLRQKSGLHFQLTGQRRDANGHENPVRISRLPVAASAPVWPGPDPQTGVSEIFVYV